MIGDDLGYVAFEVIGYFVDIVQSIMTEPKLLPLKSSVVVDLPAVSRLVYWLEGRRVVWLADCFLV